MASRSIGRPRARTSPDSDETAPTLATSKRRQLSYSAAFGVPHGLRFPPPLQLRFGQPDTIG